MKTEFYPEAAMKIEWDDLEVHPCKEYIETEIHEGRVFPKIIVEQCEENENPDFWSVYIHKIEGGLCCIADCETKEQAESLESLILALTDPK